MGTFYSYTSSTDVNKKLKLYSERGLLTYFLSILALNQPEEFLKEAVNGKGQHLSETINCNNCNDIKSLEVYCEFELGNEGFGNPDGGILIEDNQSKKYFIFIEAKSTSFDKSFCDMAKLNALRSEFDNAVDAVDAKECRRKNTFNSTINGQIELRWRFVQAFKCALKNNEHMVTEQNVKRREYSTYDKFYWRREKTPEKNESANYRRVDMEEDLRCLYESLRAVEDFYFLAITDDQEFPRQLNDTRLIEGDDKNVKGIEKYLYWLPINFIEKNIAYNKKRKIITLRSSYKKLSVSQVQSMPNVSIREKDNCGFFGHSTINHIYNLKTISGDKVVVDNATGLMWHQSGADDCLLGESMKWDETKRWLKKLNKSGYAGYQDWRLPTVDEAASLLESSDMNGNLYIDPVFSKNQRWIWTGDKFGSKKNAWCVDFIDGCVLWGHYINSSYFVRPVRSVE